jgi:hypothetical protein
MRRVAHVTICVIVVALALSAVKWTPALGSQDARPIAIQMQAPASEPAPPNPWGYNFDSGALIYNPPSNFCSYFACIASFWNGIGYVVQCLDGTFSLSGGRTGVCSSGHGGFYRNLYAPGASPTPTQTPGPTAPPSSACGVERWSVKTGTDPDAGSINLGSTTYTTVSALDALPKPSSLPADNRIAPTETTVYSIDALLTVYVREDDSDYHLVLTDTSGGTMITEIASPSCVGSGSPLLAGITNARAEFDARYLVTTGFKTANIPVRVRGVGFFDFLHGQTGVAPNGVELHPLLDIQFNPAPRCDSAGIPTSTTYLPNITRRLGGASGWDTPFFVQNAGTMTTTIEASFYHFDTGALATCHKTTGVAPGASILDDPNLATDLTDGKQYSVVVRSFGAPAVATVNQSQTSGGRIEALSYGGFSSGATRVYVPNVTRRFFGYDIPLIIQNLGTSTAFVTANFKSFDGTQNVNLPLTIGVGLSGVIDPDFTNGLVDQTQYAVTVTSNQPVAVVANAHNEAIGPLAYSHDGLAAGATTVYGAWATKGTTFSNVVVQNLGTAAATATLTFQPTSGAAAQVFATDVIPAGSASAFDVRFTNGIALAGTAACGSTASPTCLGDGDYGLTVSASQPMAAVVLPNSSTLAGAYVAAATVTSRALAPVVQRNAGGWNSPIWLQSISAASATLSFYAIGTGALAASVPLSLTPGMTMRVDPGAVNGLVNGQQYSLAIDASGMVAAVIQEFNTQAGDGLMVYEAFAQ